MGDVINDLSNEKFNLPSNQWVRLIYLSEKFWNFGIYDEKLVESYINQSKAEWNAKMIEFQKKKKSNLAPLKSLTS